MATRQIVKAAIPVPQAGPNYDVLMAIKEHLEIVSARRPGIAPIALLSDAAITDTDTRLLEVIAKVNELILTIQGQQA